MTGDGSDAEYKIQNALRLPPFHGQHGFDGSGANDVACRYDGPRQWWEAVQWAS
jgi:hypothetical protein